jgi:4-amino-4-deoxy-L-arabinose transferase-like glycosyltransferase
MKDVDGSRIIRLLILLSVIINAFGMLCPVIISGDANAYASVARHIAQHGDWMNLFLEGKDWLDKPHFPFWVTAVFFKLLGISTFSYVLAGFVFHLFGGYYTYKLARYFYDEGTALLALLVYFTTLHLVMSTIDVRAEVFLTGLIMPACYYWLKFDESPKVGYLLAGALCTACAVMTKGIFVMITIGSGLACTWLYKREWRKFLSAKWILALFLCLVFILPEVLAVYLQFDLHPEKVIFHRKSVSGLKFFFWDSQFGRLFNTGPIKNTNGSPVFYLHTFLWTFLPWTAAFLGAVYSMFRSNSRPAPAERSRSMFLYGSFLITFIIFSATLYQYDYYIDILLPFAGIISAKYLHDVLRNRDGLSWVPGVQRGFSILLLLVILGVSILAVEKNLMLIFTIVLCVVVLICAVKTRWTDPLLGAIIYPVLAMNIIFMFVGTVFLTAALRHEASYNITQFFLHQPRLGIYLWDDNDGRLVERMEVQSDLTFTRFDTIEKVKAVKGDFYLVANENKLPVIVATFPEAKVVHEVDRLQIQYFDRAYRCQTRWPKPLTRMTILRIVGASQNGTR